jgi:hypothetical protein
MQVFYRLQESGNCYLQAPILLHWYLSVWHDPRKNPQDVNFIHLSKYVRNTFSASRLYEYIINEKGGSSWETALVLMEEVAARNPYFVKKNKDYASILSLLKKRGPALAEVTALHLDFHEPGIFAYKGPPVVDLHEPGTFAFKGPPVDDTSGHTMTIIGVRQDKQRQVYYLLQNFWKGKAFVEVGQDYFLASGGTLIFMAEDAEMAPMSDKTYSEQTHSVRCAVSSPYLERATAKTLRKWSSHPKSESNVFCGGR